MTTKPKTAAERQSLRRQRRNDEIASMRAALIAIAKASTITEARTIAINALTKEK